MYDQERVRERVCTKRDKIIAQRKMTVERRKEEE